MWAHMNRKLPMAAAAVAGVAMGRATLVAMRGVETHRRTRVAAAGLLAAAAVYPGARWRPLTFDARGARSEWVTVVGAGALLVMTVLHHGRPVRLAVASGWLAHAAFDMSQDLD